MKMMNMIKQSAATLIIAAISFTGCKNTPDDVITMTTAKGGKVEFSMAGSGKAVIDWGDGSDPETVTLSAFNGSYFVAFHQQEHTFDASPRTITIDGKNVTSMDCQKLQLTTLDMTKKTALTYLICDTNQLRDQ